MIRIGKSTDIHRLKKGGTLILGGVVVAEGVSVIAHSDGDCLLHAIAECLLGAAGLGDLGTYYPDDDPAWKDCASSDIVGDVADKLFQAGYRIGNIDAMIIIEKPKMQPHIEAMRESIAKMLNIKKTNITIKATTAEGLAPIGTGEAVVCEAVALIEKVLVRL